MELDATLAAPDAAPNGATRADHTVNPEATDGPASGGAVGARSNTRRDTHRVVRWLHRYLSMISLTLIMFFGLTGITLNHPSWTLGMDGSTEAASGTLPSGFESNGSVDFLAISQYIQDKHGVRGDPTDYSADATQGSMSFKGPGYAADLFFDIDTGDYNLMVDQQGLLAVMNDLHKGRNTSTSWSWAIDVVAGLLILVAATGLGLQFFLTKRRTRAYVAATAGAIVSLILILLTIN